MGEETKQERTFILEWKDKNRESDYRGKETIGSIEELHKRMDDLIKTYGWVQFDVWEC